MLYCLFSEALWSPAGKGLYLLSLFCVVFFLCFCHFPICVMIHIRNKGEVSLSPPVIILLTYHSSVDLFSYLYSTLVYIMLSCLFIATLRSLAGKGLASLL